MILDMEDFTLEMIMEQAKAAQLKKEADAEKLPALFDKTLNALVAACEKLEAITAERDQLAATVATYRRIVDELSQPLAQGTSADFIAGVRSCVTQLEDVWLGNHESLIADIRTKAICHFKDELLAATSVMFRPHIDGVCAVVTERMQLAKDGA